MWITADVLPQRDIVRWDVKTELKHIQGLTSQNVSWLIMGSGPRRHSSHLGKIKGLKWSFSQISDPPSFSTTSDGFDMATESASCPANEVLICVSVALQSPCPWCCDTLTCFYGLKRERASELETASHVSLQKAYLDLNLVPSLPVILGPRSLIQLILLFSIIDVAKVGLSKTVGYRS